MGGSAHAASDPSSDNKLDRLQPLVQPSVVYETINWKARIWDTHNKAYIPVKVGGDTAEFTVSFRCTGYVINPAGWIATAGHCVDPREARDELIKKGIAHALSIGFYPRATSVDQLLGLIEYRANSFDDAGHLRRNQPERTIITSWGASVSGVEIAKSKPAFLRAFHKHEDGDAALLKVDESDLNAIPLGDSKNVEINDDVVAVGYPVVIDNYTDEDLTPTFDSGTVSSRKTVAHGLLPVLQLSAGLSGGMSGGPTVNSDGDVIGTNVSHFPGEPFNYSIPIDQVKELMDSSGVKNELSGTTKKYRAGITAYYAKDRTTAVKNLQAVVTEQPGNGFATDFLKKAKALPKPKPKDNGSSTLLFVLLGLVLLLLIIGGVVALLLSRRRKSPKPLAGAAAAPGASGAPGGPGMVPGPAGGPASPYAAPAPGGPPSPYAGPAPGGPVPPAGGPTGVPTGAPTSPTGYPTAPPPAGGTPVSEPPAPVGADSGSSPTGGLVPPAPQSPNGRGDQPAEPGPGLGAAPGSGGERTGPISATTAVSEGDEAGHHFCTNCGAKVSETTKFCGECGTHL